MVFADFACKAHVFRKGAALAGQHVAFCRKFIGEVELVLVIDDVACLVVGAVDGDRFLCLVVDGAVGKRKRVVAARVSRVAA